MPKAVYKLRQTNQNQLCPSRPADNAAWKAIVLKYQKSSAWRANWQIVNTIVPYGAIWYLMCICKPISWWLVVPLAILAGAFLVRVFIIFHDCGHGSFYKSRGANDLVGFSSGILTFTPLLPLALGTRHPPQQLGRPGQARHGRYLDDDGAGISGIFPLEKVRVPAGAATRSFCLSSHRCSCLPSGNGFRRPRPASGNAIRYMP